VLPRILQSAPNRCKAPPRHRFCRQSLIASIEIRRNRQRAVFKIARCDEPKFHETDVVDINFSVGTDTCPTTARAAPARPRRCWAIGTRSTPRVMAPRWPHRASCTLTPPITTILSSLRACSLISVFFFFVVVVLVFFFCFVFGTGTFFRPIPWQPVSFPHPPRVRLFLCVYDVHLMLCISPLGMYPDPLPDGCDFLFFF
jgi:hypothetical protein